VSPPYDGPLRCEVCTEMVGHEAEMYTHVATRHPIMLSRWQEHRAGRDDDVSLPDFLWGLDLWTFELTTGDADGRPIPDQVPVLVRTDMRGTVGWCSMCDEISEPFDLMNHFLRRDRHEPLFTGDVAQYALRTVDRDDEFLRRRR